MRYKHLWQRLFEPVSLFDLVQQTIDHRLLHQNGVQHSESFPRCLDQRIECSVSSGRKRRKEKKKQRKLIVVLAQFACIDVSYH